MRKILMLMVAMVLIAGPVLAGPEVIIQTTLGDIRVELEAEKAPVSVENFLAYADAGYYDGTIFHRVIRNFMVQGGGFTENMVQKSTRAPIRNEADNGLKNSRGTLAMARTADINSATSQFFINLVDNTFLDHKVRDYGYAVFGRVVEGMDVVDKLASVPTGVKSGMRDVPTVPVLIKKVVRVDAGGKEE